MSADSFTALNERNNVQEINEAAQGGFMNFLFGDNSQEAAQNIARDFFDAYKEDPAAALNEWKAIKADIHSGDLNLPALGLIDAYAKNAEETMSRT
jgi:hypothetical protein